MALEDFERPVVTAMRTQFLTVRAAARHMIGQESGAILVFGGEQDPLPVARLGGFRVALGAIEAFRRQLAGELGPHGIRVVTLQTSGIPETISENVGARGALVDYMVGSTMLKRVATLEDVGNVAAFLASDRARTLTATATNMTCGAEVDQTASTRPRQRLPLAATRLPPRTSDETKTAIWTPRNPSLRTRPSVRREAMNDVQQPVQETID